MNVELIEQLAAIVTRTGIEELDFTENGVRIRLLKSAVQDERSQEEPESVRSVFSTVETTPAVANEIVARHEVVAGMSGTFYRASAPTEPPFVNLGDTVKQGQVLCVVEAMKMLNQIEADASGKVVRIAMENGVAVQATTVLFEIEPEECDD